jgi:isopenicillin-N epimerase
VIEVAVPFPTSNPVQIIDAVAARLGPRSRLVILDHVSSLSAVVFPIRELTSLCHKAGANVLIDGAHAPGMLSLDIPAIDADWYVGNCHKWLMAPRGSGFLWASPAKRADTHPLVISHGYAQGFAAEFDWVGTRDPTAWLTVPAAIDFTSAAADTCCGSGMRGSRGRPRTCSPNVGTRSVVQTMP